MLDKNKTDLSLKVNQQVLNCEIKDQTGLNDFQKLPDLEQVAIQQVGINRFRIPMSFMHADESIMNHDCTAGMWVNLPKGKTGINMSRLCAILQQESLRQVVSPLMIETVLNRYKTEMRDSQADDEFAAASLKINFSYPLKQKSLKSDNWGWQYYSCEVEGNLDHLYLTVKYEYSSTCPCSLSMAKQYERDFEAGLTQEGSGIGVAHSQRSQATCKVEVKKDSIFWIEDLIDLLREAIPTETQSLVKRIDEQAFAILNGANPMFVEHVSKRLHQGLNSHHEILDWAVEIEHWESLHSHNAYAMIFKGNEGGLNRI
jgi:GTP cyclohydrolase I